MQTIRSLGRRWGMCAVAACVLVGCGGGTGDLFPEPSDGGLGTAEEGLSARFSSLYTFGANSSPSAWKCTASSGGGTGQSCLLPGAGRVIYKVTGYDPFEFGPGGETLKSWKIEGMRPLGDIKNETITGGYGWPFGTPVNDPANAWVEITNGDCPLPVRHNLIQAVACVEWTLGSSPLVTETFPGAYRRFTGTAKIIFDNEAYQEILDYGISNTIPAPVGLDDEHEIVEHAMHAVMPALYGSGLYTADQPSPHTFAETSWSSPHIWSQPGGYDHAGYTDGDRCRVGSWVNGPVTSAFSQLPGSCPN